MTQTFKQILRNFGWLLFDKVLRLGIGIWVMSLMAQYLGPAQLGLYNYAYSFIALFLIIATMGMESIVVRELVSGHFDKGTILGTALRARLVASMVAWFIAVGSIMAVRPHDETMFWLIILFGWWLPATAADVFDYLFQSQYKNKVSVVIKNLAFLIASVGRIWVIKTDAGLKALVICFVTEMVLAAIGLMVAFKWGKTPFKALPFSKILLKKLLRDSWPLALAGALTTIYIRIDQIMLGEMAGNQAVGIYSAAVRLSEVWYFMPIIIGNAVMPGLIGSFKQDKSHYLQQFKLYYGLLAWLAIALGFVTMLVGPWLINWLYGPAFAAASPVLQLHIWAAIFVFLGVASGQYLTIEQQTKLAMHRAFWGTLSNVLLNAYFIPKWGGIGAAWATIISYFISVFFIILPKETRLHGVLMFRALVPWLVPWSLMKQLFGKR